MSAELSTAGQVLTTHALSAGYDGRAIVHEIDLEATPGKVVSIVGPNGSGKSTLLKALVGVVPVLAGQVNVAGQDITNQPPERVATLGVGYVPQVDDVFAPLTVKENLEIGGYLLARHEVPSRIEAVLESFPRLKSMMSRRAGKLSGGERKMLAMGRVLMLAPSVLVLDEPTANLAPQVATQLLEEYIRGFADRGSTVLLVEQRARAALRISDWTLVLGGGRIVLAGAPSELQDNPVFVESFLGGGAARH
ncbi:MAG: ABC transporter ATP-binding protein [Acidobacteriota bacterium]|nr:ABC transporter ATP-binding protein [Acidobacteriota bacterium]